MPPASGGAGGSRIVLEATDGNRFAAFAARTDAAEAPGVVILPEVRGSTASMKSSRSGSPRRVSVCMP
jgi:hypothetical protein